VLIAVGSSAFDSVEAISRTIQNPPHAGSSLNSHIVSIQKDSAHIEIGTVFVWFISTLTCLGERHSRCISRINIKDPREMLSGLKDVVQTHIEYNWLWSPISQSHALDVSERSEQGCCGVTAVYNSTFNPQFPITRAFIERHFSDEKA
jgi:hypothetical protein